MEYLEKYQLIIQEVSPKVELGKKKLQKLMYLIERIGVDLDLNYSIHFFGPYSSKLDNALHYLESQECIQIDTNGMTHVILLGESISNEHLTKEDQEKVDFVLTHFMGKSAIELEAITTLDYAATNLLKGDATDTEVINEVKHIKGNKFSDDYLKRGLGLLKEYKYLQ